MEVSKNGYNLMFCDLCGTMLSTSSHKFAKCSLCGFKRKAKEFEGQEISYSVSAEDYRRSLNKMNPFIKVDATMDINIEVQKKKSDKLCTACRKAHYEYHEQQTRSADEGMTVFYTCPECGHREKENN
ncbi:hypothetical protein ACHQM5_026387 [Ranunculus cassubicifolius]